MWYVVNKNDLEQRDQVKYKAAPLFDGSEQFIIRCDGVNSDYFRSFIKYDIEKIMAAKKNKTKLQEKTINRTLSTPISSNISIDDKLLYTRVHGLKSNVQANKKHIFEFEIPYNEIYFQGSEVLSDIIGVCDYDIYHNELGIMQQYAFDLNVGVIKYSRESKYAARLKKGLKLRCSYLNDTDTEQEIGVNFIMHEIVGDK